MVRLEWIISWLPHLLREVPQFSTPKQETSSNEGESSQETVKNQHHIRKNIYTIKKANIKVDFFLNQQ